ncbi:MAG: ACT domain-containing protein [Ruminococcus sp.]
MDISISLQIVSKDRIGLVSEISGIISELNIAIVNHKARVYNNRNKEIISDFKVDVQTDNDKNIDVLIRRLNKLKGVISVQLL